MTGRAVILGGDAARLPLPDESVDCIVTSPPYWGKRSYEDDGEAIEGQLGSEEDWRDYLDGLVGWTAEWARVLRPWGSIFVVIDDKYSDRGHGPNQGRGTSRGPQGGAALPQSRGAREKSLLNLPFRYAIRCTDELRLIHRATIVWEKSNGLPASAKDRVRQDHEVILHFTKRPRYFEATDLIREPVQHPGKSRTSAKARQAWVWAGEWKAKQGGLADGGEHPLGRIPGSVWRINNYPLKAPRYYWRERGRVRWLRDDAEAWRWAGDTGRGSCAVPRDDSAGELRAAPDHYAACPPELVRRLLLGWAPQRVCLACGQGRFPVTERETVPLRPGDNPGRSRLNGDAAHGPDRRAGTHAASASVITGWACACTPATLARRRSRTPTVTPGRMLARGPEAQDLRAAASGSRHHGYAWPDRAPAKIYHLDGWEPPPSRPGVVLDPCSGTGTVALVAAVLGMTGLGVELSHDYRLLGSWRTADPGERAAALGVARPRPEPHDQGILELFGADGRPL